MRLLRLDAGEIRPSVLSKETFYTKDFLDRRRQVDVFLRIYQYALYKIFLFLIVWIVARWPVRFRFRIQELKKNFLRIW